MDEIDSQLSISVPSNLPGQEAAMKRTWELQNARDELSEVVEAALTDGPQVIMNQGVKTAIVLSFADYRRLLNQQKLSEFFRESPLAEVDLDLARDLSPGRAM